ncbi:protein kinase [Pendulispora rubella]|uniref:Protein kinase n=1 Tax=Pendulispora rubella TaxID=2741070 RepID=A0ABZ2LF26_9BACT
MTDNFEYPSGILIPGTKYKVIRRLGAGGMGTVYEVEDTNIEKRYVLKTLHASLSSRADLAERMRREARALARLEHRNIVQVITADVTADSLRLTYLVMEKLNGHTLRTVLDNKTRLNVDTACRLSIDLLNALYHAHENRIIHRDVKPENIFLHRDADGTTVTKLLDFGIMTEADPETHTQTGHNRFIGTLRYAAPEQLSGRPITAQTDIYAAGLCLYEIITGYGPFDDLSSTSEIAHAHLNTIAPPISRHVRVPRQLEDIVRRALAKDPADRQHDAFTFAAELNRFRKSQQGALEMASLSQVETVNDPFHLSTDPGAQQRGLGISGASFARPASGGASPPPAGAPLVGGAPPYPSAPQAGAGPGAAAPAMQPSPQPLRWSEGGSSEGGSGVRASGHGTGDYPQPPGYSGSGSVPDAGSSGPSPARPGFAALADAATEFDEGDGSGSGPFPPAAGETHENALAAPMTIGGPTPVPAASFRGPLSPHPASGGSVDRNAPTGTYAPPGAPDVERSGTAIMSSVDAPSDPGHPRTLTLPQPHLQPQGSLAHSAMPVNPSYATAPAAPPPAKRGLGPVIWIVVAGSAIGAVLAIGGIYQLSARGPKSAPETITATAPSPSALGAPASAAPEPAKTTSATENVGALDAGAPAAASASAGAASPAESAKAAEDRSHRHRDTPRPSGGSGSPSPSTKKLPGSGL